VNVAEEYATEELSPHKELFTTVESLVAAATSCFHVHCHCQSCWTNSIAKVRDSEFIDLI